MKYEKILDISHLFHYTKNILTFFSIYQQRMHRRQFLPTIHEQLLAESDRKTYGSKIHSAATEEVLYGTSKSKACITNTISQHY